MFWCDCLYWNQEDHEPEDLHFQPDPEPFSLPSPLPDWPQGQGFGRGSINLGEIEVIKIMKLEKVWSCNLLRGKKSKGVTFYKPVDIPNGFYCLGYYCQPSDKPLRGYLLVAREINTANAELSCPALRKPVSYTLIWTVRSQHDDFGYFWLPNPPKGYKAMGVVVTNNSNEPKLDEIRCVHKDLTETCETLDILLSTDSHSKNYPFQVWNTIPCDRGMSCKGVSVGTFYCGAYLSSGDELVEVACLKNLDSSFHAMPNLNQIHKLISHYGPTVFFHPDETYFPSSVPWFFKNGALLYKEGKQKSEKIDCFGSNLPKGGENDGAYWIDLPADADKKNRVRNGDLDSAELYVHIKPALGGTFTDIAMWIFCPFNGPATMKIGLVSIEMTKIGQHVCDWEHFTLRVSNFTGELWQMFCSEHSGGKWTDAFDLEFVKGGNKPIVYSSKHGHASFPHEGTFIQGSSKLGIGIRNDVARSDFFMDSSTRHCIVAAEYLGDEVVEEPCWLQYMREWGPTVVYDSRAELDKLISLLPFFARFSMENIFDLFPTELYGEEGPTGPKEKDNWIGDEIC